MIEVVGDLWSYDADMHCITTNGVVSARGKAVMGRGVARQAVVRFPRCAELLGKMIQQGGNCVHSLGRWENPPHKPINLVSFPVKHHWRDIADLELIATSCRQLVELLDEAQRFDGRIEHVVLPRPGCANGMRHWEGEVKPIVADLLDDRFHIIDR